MGFKILAVHNRYLIGGGEDQSHKVEVALLRNYGHEVDEYVEDNRKITDMGVLSTAIRTIWSSETYRNIHKIIRKRRYDFIHIQNTFPLISPSIYYIAQSEHIPIIQNLRNYRLLCPNALFFRNNKICEDCLGKHIPFPGVIHRCYRNSLSASFVVVSMLTIHRAMGTWSKKIDAYIVLTEFAREKFIEGGLPPKKIFVKPNFIIDNFEVGTGEGKYFLFVGRFSPEKGIETLLNAWKILPKGVKLKIVGEGPLVDQVKFVANQQSNVEFLGIVSNAEVLALMKNASALVFPSLWYEGFPRTIVEAYAVGLPVIASAVGNVSDIVKNNETGLHFLPSDPGDLAKKVKFLVDRPEFNLRIRKNARTMFEEKYTPEINYQTLMDIYQKVLSNYGRNRHPQS